VLDSALSAADIHCAHAYRKQQVAIVAHAIVVDSGQLGNSAQRRPLLPVPGPVGLQSHIALRRSPDGTIGFASAKVHR
jgi:hypothetical protein